MTAKIGPLWGTTVNNVRSINDIFYHETRKLCDHLGIVAPGRYHQKFRIILTFDDESEVLTHDIPTHARILGLVSKEEQKMRLARYAEDPRAHWLMRELPEEEFEVGDLVNIKRCRWYDSNCYTGGDKI